MKPDSATEEQELAELNKPVVTPRQVIILASAFILVWASTGVVVLCSDIEVKDAGPFGDAFGTINAFFSGAAFVGIIYTILLQQRELRLQRYELKLTRDELRRSAAAQEKSEHALNTQASSLLLSSQITALTSRIEAYNFQIDDTQGVDTVTNQRLRTERHSLVVELDKLLQRANTLASAYVAKPNTQT
jgi:hypothetical protein